MPIDLDATARATCHPQIDRTKWIDLDGRRLEASVAGIAEPRRSAVLGENARALFNA